MPNREAHSKVQWSSHGNRQIIDSIDSDRCHTYSQSSKGLFSARIAFSHGV